MQYNIHGSNNDSISVIDLFLKIGLLHDNSDEIIIKACRMKRIKSWKIHETSYTSIPELLNWKHWNPRRNHHIFPWTIPNYYALVRYFGKIKSLFQIRSVKF